MLDRIRAKGMVPGLWLEPEVSGIHSTLAAKPDSWFFMRHGRRVIKNDRLLLDFRSPDVRSYLDTVVERLVKECGIGCIKMDYNTDTLEGTTQNDDSPGQVKRDPISDKSSMFLLVSPRSISFSIIPRSSY